MARLLGTTLEGPPVSVLATRPLDVEAAKPLPV
jgi:hypothetical protein